MPAPLCSVVDEPREVILSAESRSRVPVPQDDHLYSDDQKESLVEGESDQMRRKLLAAHLADSKNSEVGAEQTNAMVYRRNPQRPLNSPVQEEVHFPAESKENSVK